MSLRDNVGEEDVRLKLKVGREGGRWVELTFVLRRYLEERETSASVKGKGLSQDGLTM